MSRGMTPAVVEAVLGEVVHRCTAVELDFPDGFARLNSSPTSIWIDGNEFLGVGALGAISVTEESAELKAQGMTVSLTAIPRDAIGYALTQNYQGRPATVWEVVLDPDTGQPIADPIIVFRGRMDQMDVQLGDTATVVCRLENRLTDWERPTLRRYTAEDQQRRHPNDRFFSFVPSTVEKEIVWPAANYWR